MNRAFPSLSFACLTFSAALVACSSGHDGTGAPTDPVANCTIAIDRFKELTIVDDSVTSDPRAKNATDGAWSFRHLIENAVPQGMSTSEFMMAWLQDWASRVQYNDFTLDRESRTQAMNDVVICPWLHRTPSNNCDASCKSCTTTILDASQAPFRLLGIVNRMDLREKPDATGPSGEGRLAFGFTDGVGDDPASPPGPMSVIFEYALPGTRSPAQWANAWHELGSHPQFDEGYKVALQNLTDSFTARGADSTRPNGSALSQVRTNESLLNWIWQLREFALDTASGKLLLTSVKDTPAEPFNGSPELVTLIQQNRDAILADKFVVPTYMLGGSVDQFLFRWNLPGLDGQTRDAFSKTTCNGCHGETATTDTAFHLSPFRAGVAKVSPFLNDPSQPGKDELSRRELSAKTLLCAP